MHFLLQITLNQQKAVFTVIYWYHDFIHWMFH